MSPRHKGMTAESRVLLYSGGMDSVAAWHLLGQPRRVYVRIGAPYEARELESLEARGELLGSDGVDVLDGPRWLGGMAERDGHVPLRNLYFAVAAAAATGASEVLLGALAGETSGDKCRRFARHASRAMTLAEGRPVRLRLPVRHLTKAQLAARLLAALGRERGEAALRACPSCYAGRLGPGTAGCGRCSSCLRRWVAMWGNGITERYEQPPWEQPAVRPSAAWWRYLRRVPVAEWPGVARANWELWLALRSGPAEDAGR